MIEEGANFSTADFYGKVCIMLFYCLVDSSFHLIFHTSRSPTMLHFSKLATSILNQARKKKTIKRKEKKG